MDGAQLGLMLAQIRNLNADADKKKAEATKTAGVDTQAQQPIYAHIEYIVFC